LYSSYDLTGERNDEFERFLTEYVDSPCASAMKRAASNPQDLTEEERRVVALFIGFAAARTRTLIEGVEQIRQESEPTDESLLRLWSETVNKPLSSDTDRQLFKESILGAAAFSAIRWQHRILSWKWCFVKTGRDEPFISSDWPALGDRHRNYAVLTFPISSEVALVTGNHPDFGVPDRGVENIKFINGRTLQRATRFVVCHKDSFPGEKFLKDWVGQKS
jgi:hypothetical protein